jgi:hypothetical protein
VEQSNDVLTQGSETTPSSKSCTDFLSSELLLELGEEALLLRSSTIIVGLG